jgi:hypothetical protein
VGHKIRCSGSRTQTGKKCVPNFELETLTKTPLGRHTFVPDGIITMVVKIPYTLEIWAGVGLREHGDVPYDRGTVLEQMRSD